MVAFQSAQTDSYASQEGEFKVLVVDDFEPIRREIKWSLEGLYGVTVITADNGEEGLKRMVEDQPALVILDLKMPVMDGFAVLERRKLIDSIRDIPVVVLTATETENDTITRVLMAGATDYLRKPIDAQDMSQYVSARVALARQQRERQISHDLASPLSAVIAFAEFLQEPATAQNPEEVFRLARQIAESGRRLRHAIEKMLEES